MIKRTIPIIGLFILAVIIGIIFEKPTQIILKSGDSPFGIHNPKVASRLLPENMDKPKGMDDYSSFTEIDAKWLRHAGFEGLVWNDVEKTKGMYDWEKNDFIITETYQQGIKMMISIHGFNRWDQGISKPNGMAPKDTNAYQKFLEKAVERYDGDGMDDAPKSPVVDVWQIENEVDGKNFWKDTPENYAKLLKASYETIKKANPNAKVAIAGVASPPGFYKFYRNIFDELAKDKNKQYFDIFDFHWSGQFEGENNYREESFPEGNYSMESFIADIKKALNEINYKKVSLWITEMSDYEGQPQKHFVKTFAYKDESYQAAQIIKRYVYPLAHGVEKIFWVTLTEWHNFDRVHSTYFDHVGLINNPENDEKSYKKLSYYTYKKMTEILDGSDWNTIQILQEADGIYMYELTKNDTSIWIVWNDNEEEKQITLPTSPSIIKITEAVPKYASGAQVTDYNTTFNTINQTQNDKITVGKTPLLIEQK